MFKLLMFRLLMVLTAVCFANIVLGQSISLSGNPPTLAITSAIAGSQPTSVTNATTTYSVTALLVVRSVTGSINSNMPTGTTLSVQLAPPAGATSLGSVPMTTTAATLVTGIPILTVLNSLTVTYLFSCNAAATPVTNATKTLTLTIQ